MMKSRNRWMAAGVIAALGAGFLAGWKGGTAAVDQSLETLQAGMVKAANSTAAPGNERADRLTENAQGAAEVPAAVDPAEAYSSKHPALMALTVSEPADSVVSRYGQPLSRFTMEDGKDPVTVYEYDGFSAGFDSKSRLIFVEVASASTDPGLNGIRLGSKAGDAVQTLGKPDTDTGYVLSYRTKAAVLKLDVDPQNGVIQSIRLFGRADE